MFIAWLFTACEITQFLKITEITFPGNSVLSASEMSIDKETYAQCTPHWYI